MSSLINHFYRFGDFTVDADQRVLLRGGKPLPVTPKVFDTLLILVENQGRIVEKDELMKRIWPDTFVEEANIAINIQQLRKTLRDNARAPRYIETVARRGYRFIAEVETVRSGNSSHGTSHIERPELHTPAAGNGQPSGPFVNPTKQQFSISGESILAGRDRHATPLILGRGLIGIAVIVLLLAAAGFLFWKLSTMRLGDFGFVERAAPSTLKIEPLTVTGQSRQAAISPDGKYIAYTRTLEKKTGIWLRQLATNTNVEIVPASELIYGLAFAHSGEYLYFVKGDAPRALFRVSLLGGVPTKLAYGSEGNISVSPDDTQIGLIRQSISKEGQREYSLVVVKSDGSGERTISTSTHPYRLDTPLFSADGATITCAYGNATGGKLNSSLVEFRVSDGAKKELSSVKFFGIQKLALLPNGNGLILAGRKNPDDPNQLWRVSYPGMEVSQISEGVISFLDFSLTASADKAAASQMTFISDIWIGPSREPKSLKRITQATGPFAWTPDGQQLVYSSTASGNRDLWITRQDGSDQRQLTANPALDTGPTVTADSQYIVFLSYRTGTFQVWRMNLNGGNEIQLTNGEGKHSPTTTPDSKWVFYNSTDYWHLWKVSIDGGEPVRVTDYPAVSSAISPDGKLIACAGRTEPKQAMSILILSIEGGQPLKQIEVASYSGSRIRWTPDSKAVMYSVESSGRTVIFKQSLAGGPPEEIAGIDQDEIFDFDYSNDGKFLAVTRGRWQHDIVLISNINP